MQAACVFVLVLQVGLSQPVEKIENLDLANEQRRIYTNDFAVCIRGNGSDADQIASRYGFENKGEIGGFGDCFLFRTLKAIYPQKERLKHFYMLKRDPHVLWVQQQEIKRRSKREIKYWDRAVDEFRSESHFLFPDPLFPEQWYLNKGARGGYDMNVKDAWRMGYSGKGIVVTILDDGIQVDHPDLKNNFDWRASYDLNDLDPDPTPRNNGKNKHGTRCAGEVASEAYNEFCGVGIAFNAKIGGVRMLDGNVTDAMEADALRLNSDHIHIYSASWGPDDDGKTVDGPGILARRAFMDGVTKGRKGLGSIYVWAAGNGGKFLDDCNCDGYTNSIYTLTVNSATQSGRKPRYTEECASTLATTYSSGDPLYDGKVITIDLYRPIPGSRTPHSKTAYLENAKLCTKSHTGTSASAPIAASICALALEANPMLTWRDMQYLVILTSKYQPLRYETGWSTNGVKRKVNPKFGYGLMDATEMVNLAKIWQTVPRQHSCHVFPKTQKSTIPSENWKMLRISQVVQGCESSHNPVRYLEHVQLVISADYFPRGKLNILLSSPAGTRSTMLLPRPLDSRGTSFRNWTFLSVHFWGESPRGKWTLTLRNGSNHRATKVGQLKGWSLVLHGTTSNPFRPSYREN